MTRNEACDICVRLADTPGALADFGEALGRAGIALEGGGMFTVDGGGWAHFLVADGAGAKRALEGRSACGAARRPNRGP